MRKRASQKPFLKAPFMIIWELISPPRTDWGALQDKTTRSMLQKKLTLEERKSVVDQIREFGQLKLIFSGGDLFAEEGFLELVSYATEVGLVVSVRPTIKKVIPLEVLEELKEAGVRNFSVDMHSTEQKIHDTMASPGSYKVSWETIENVIESRIPLQINTGLTTTTYPHIKKLGRKLQSYPLVLWNIAISLVEEDKIPSASQCELLYQWLYDFSKDARFDIKTTSGQQFHRVIIQNKRRENQISGSYIHYRDALLNGLSGVAGGIERAPYGINDGRGMMFISHHNDVYPSSMLPIKIGNVLESKLSYIYRNSPVLKKIHDAELLKGKCGLCEFRNICGGSRARAYLLTGDYLAADPHCLYKTLEAYKEESLIIHD